MGKTLLKGQLLFLILTVLIFVPKYGFSEDFLDRLMEKCSKGDIKACDDINRLTDKYKSRVDYAKVYENLLHKGAELAIYIYLNLYFRSQVVRIIG